MLKEKCVDCLRGFRAHLLICLSRYLSDDDTDDAREEDSAPPDVEPFVSNDNNLVSNNISGT